MILRRWAAKRAIFSPFIKYLIITNGFILFRLVLGKGSSNQSHPEGYLKSNKIY
jgi:hypothetical protein